MARPTLSLLVLVSLGGCECLPGTSTSPKPFSVVQVTPDSRVIPVEATFVATFSEDVDSATVSADSVVLAPTERVNDSFLSDFANPPLSADRRAALIPLTVNASGATITLTPTGVMTPDTAVTLLLSKNLKGKSGEALRDQKGVAGPFRLDFITQPPAPVIVETSLPSGPSPVVPPNLRTLQLMADKPLAGADSSAVQLLSKTDRVPNAEVASVQVLVDGVTVRVTLKDSATCHPLCPSAQYELKAGAPLHSLDGPALAPFSKTLSTEANPDTEAPILLEVPYIQPSEEWAAVAVSVKEPAEGKLLLGPPGGPYTRTFEFTPSGPCTGISERQRCPLALTVTDLSLVQDGVDAGVPADGGLIGCGDGGTGFVPGPGRTYGAILEFWDAYGNTARYGEFPITTVRLPRLLITEVYNNPPGSSADENTAEFVEITNTSRNECYDLQLLSLATHDVGDRIVRDGVHDPTMNMGPYFGGAPTVIHPGQRAVVGGHLFDPRAVGAPQDALVMVDPAVREAFLSGLSSSKSSRRLLALYYGDQDDLSAPLVSFFRAPEELYAPSSTFPEGKSAERRGLVSNDFLAEWCVSQDGPTPAQPNSVDALAGCPVP